MAVKTEIAWCDSTANYWRGCTEVSKRESGGGGCDNCYAEAMNKWLHGGANWGPGAPRHKYDTTSRIVRSWQRNAARFYDEHGRRRRVFVNSTSDIMDNEVPDAWRSEIYADVRECPDLLFYFLTKRIGNAARMLPADWGDGYPNVMLMATVVNQHEADRDVPKLLDLPARWRGLSVEPQLGPIDLTRKIAGRAGSAFGYWGFGVFEQGLDLVIEGFESGRRARPGHPDWARNLRDQCEAAGTAYFFKQWGEWLPDSQRTMANEIIGPRDGSASITYYEYPNGPLVMGKRFGDRTCKVGTKAAGRLLDGREHLNFPRDFK